jgi:hypothetical protein
MRYLLCIFGLLSGTARAQESAAFTSSNLPIVVIDTHGLVIVDEPKITASMGVIDNGPGVRNNITDPFNDYSGGIGIEIRGSSSQMFPKKQYAVETRDSAGNGTKVSLLGLPSESDWILGAPYNDKSLMRDALMYEIARSCGRYASRARYCELVLNNDYQGIYVLFENIKRDKNRVAISKMETADTTGDALTGGYIIKVDKAEGSGTAGWYSSFLPFPSARQRIIYQYHYPRPEDVVAKQQAYIQQWIYQFEFLMASPGYADTANGYPRLIDGDSFVDFFLLNELSKNVDAYRLSSFMYKDRNSKGGKMVMGPIWDFNHGFGNSDYYDASLIPGYQLTYLTTNVSFMQYDDFQPPFWWTKLFSDPNFKRRAGERWKEFRKSQFSLIRVFSTIDSIVVLLNESQARNFVRWPVLGHYVWPNYFIGQSWQEEIAYLKAWISNRLTWMDGDLGTTDVAPSDGPGVVPTSFSLAQNYPNPFNAGTTFEFTTARSGHAALTIIDLLGREVATVVDGELPAGRHTVRFEARVPDGQGTALASGTYLYRLAADGRTDVRKLVLLK